MQVKEYIKSLLRPDSKDSIKSLAMFLSVIIMCVLSLGVLGCICYEVYASGHIVTSLVDYGIFEVLLGGMVLGGSIPKMVTDKAKITNSKLGKIAEYVEERVDDSVENHHGMNEDEYDECLEDEELIEIEKPRKRGRKKKGE